MGKKAWLFFGNEQAGETAAVFYTLTMTYSATTSTCRRTCWISSAGSAPRRRPNWNRCCPIGGSKTIRKPASGSVPKNRMPRCCPQTPATRPATVRRPQRLAPSSSTKPLDRGLPLPLALDSPRNHSLAWLPPNQPVPLQRSRPFAP